MVGDWYDPIFRGGRNFWNIYCLHLLHSFDSMKYTVLRIGLVFLGIVLLDIGFGLTQPTETVQIPMRDGKSLAGDIYYPGEGSFPTILIMTPYGKIFYANQGLPLGVRKNILESKYAFVIVDWRCRFESLNACAVGSSNGEDGYDVVEWIANQTWSDGNVGMWGPSALGNIQYQTAAQQPPHLICCVPEVAAPQFSYNKYYPGGCLTVESLSTLDFLFGISGPIVNNPHYNFIWQVAENSTMYAQDIVVPMLLVGGWYDQNTDQVLRMMDALSSSSSDSVRSEHRLLMGPWVHGGTGQAFVGSEKQGQLSYGNAEGVNVEFAIEFFDFHLRNIENGWDARAPVYYFQMGDDQWEDAAAWPPGDYTELSFHLTTSKSLIPEIPEAGIIDFVYDPEDPSPTVGGKTLNLDLDQGPYDQSLLVENRADALIFSTAPLNEPVAITGAIEIKLHISSDRKDTDIAVRITDVYPDGRSMLLIDGIQRMRFRNGYRVQDTVFMRSGEIYPLAIRLDDLAHTFLPGHQLRLIVTSSNYPRYNRNMNTGGEMYPNGNYDTLVNPLVAHNRIYVGPQHPSQMLLPVKSTATSTQVQTQGLEWHLWPNPADDEVWLTSTRSARLSLVDLRGRLILSLVTAESEPYLIDVADLMPGLYFVHLEMEDHHMTKKLLIR